MLLFADALNDIFRQAAHPLLDRSIEEEIRERGHRGDRQQTQADEIDEQPGLNLRPGLTFAPLATQPEQTAQQDKAEHHERREVKRRKRV